MTLTAAAITTRLDIEGMSCASCASHIERKLNKLPETHAVVNFATDEATVEHNSNISTDTLVAAVKKAGYQATVAENRFPEHTGLAVRKNTLTEETPTEEPVASETPSDHHAGSSTSTSTRISPQAFHTESNYSPESQPASRLLSDHFRPEGHRSTHRTRGDRADRASKADRTKSERSTVALRRILVCAILAVPVVVMAMVPLWQFTYWQWVSLALTIPIATWGAWPYHRSSFVSLRHGMTTMDTLVSTGVIAAFSWSVYALLFGTAGTPGMKHSFDFIAHHDDGSGNIYFEAVAVLTVFLLTGQYLQERSKVSAGRALKALLSLGVRDVAVRKKSSSGIAVVTLPVAQLRVGDEFIVRPGEKIATDGVIIEGTSAIDASMLTGESLPVTCHIGDTVTGSTLNVGNPLIVRATRVGADTTLSQLARLVKEAQTHKAPVQKLVDRISFVFVPAVVALSIATFAVWLALGSLSQALTAAIAVLIVACPCAMGLATPLALLSGTSRGAQLGLLIKSTEVLEDTRNTDTVVLDKTGTITTGIMELRLIEALPGEEDSALRLASSIETGSEHPIARAITRAAGERKLDIPTSRSVTSRPGRGIEGVAGDLRVIVAQPNHLLDSGYRLPEELEHAQSQMTQAGTTLVGVGWNDTIHALLALGDTVKITTPQAIRDLRRLGLTPIMLTGDNSATAHRVGQQVGIDRIVAGILPADKVSVVKDLQHNGHTVAMIGDGINDSAALAQADLGIAMGTGTDASIEAADITIIDGNLQKVPVAIRLSRRTLTTIRGNLFWAFAYNVAAIPLAALGLLNPMVAGAAMALSSLFVVANSLLLQTFRP